MAHRLTTVSEKRGIINLIRDDIPQQRSEIVFLIVENRRRSNDMVRISSGHGIVSPNRKDQMRTGYMSYQKPRCTTSICHVRERGENV